jgi:molecular chaperone DnaJ
MGKVRAQQGFFTIERTCHTCNGSGQMIKKPCGHCNGQGRARKDRTLSVSIPAGVDEGTRMRLNGEGEVGVRSARAGDLYIFISLIPHKFFQREGNDIYCEVPIKMTSLALGTSIEVPTIDGSKAKVIIPAGTQSDQQFRLRGKGMRDLDRGTRGDMYIQVQVEIPVNLSKKQKELLKEFDDTIDSKGSQPKSDSFFNKVKEFWGDL